MSTKMTKLWSPKLLIVLLSLIVACAAIASYPRAMQCLAYRKLTRIGAASANLAADPKVTEIRFVGDSQVFSAGYSDTGFPPEWITRVVLSQGTAISVYGGDGTVVFMPPVFESQFSSDGNYSWAIETSRTKIQSFTDVFAMSRAEFQDLTMRTLPKALDMYNQNGIGHFETEQTRGIIRFGPSHRPGDVNVEVWSKHGRVSQGILIRAQRAETSSRLLQCVLSKLRYSVNEIPERLALENMIVRAVERHDSFESQPASEKLDKKLSVK